MATDPNQGRKELNPIPEENKGNIADITGDDGVDNSLELKQEEDIDNQPQQIIVGDKEIAEQQAIISDIVINQSRKTKKNNNNNPPIWSTLSAAANPVDPDNPNDNPDDDQADYTNYAAYGFGLTASQSMEQQPQNYPSNNQPLGLMLNTRRDSDRPWYKQVVNTESVLGVQSTRSSRRRRAGSRSSKHKTILSPMDTADDVEIEPIGNNDDDDDGKDDEKKGPHPLIDRYMAGLNNNNNDNIQAVQRRSYLQKQEELLEKLTIYYEEKIKQGVQRFEDEQMEQNIKAMSRIIMFGNQMRNNGINNQNTIDLAQQMMIMKVLKVQTQSGSLELTKPDFTYTGDHKGLGLSELVDKYINYIGINEIDYKTPRAFYLAQRFCKGNALIMYNLHGTQLGSNICRLFALFHIMFEHKHNVHEALKEFWNYKQGKDKIQVYVVTTHELLKNVVKRIDDHNMHHPGKFKMLYPPAQLIWNKIINGISDTRIRYKVREKESRNNTSNNLEKLMENILQQSQERSEIDEMWQPMITLGDLYGLPTKRSTSRSISRGRGRGYNRRYNNRGRSRGRSGSRRRGGRTYGRGTGRGYRSRGRGRGYNNQRTR